MAFHGHSHRRMEIRLPSWRGDRTTSIPASGEKAATTSTAARAHVLATLRVLTGFVFLWAFFDKTFGWGYATQPGEAWTDGASPTKGYLSGVAAGPMESTFHAWAGNAWADWLFMLGLLGIGLALTGGIALRLAAAAGTAMMALLWAAAWPLAEHLSDGTLSMSTNPLVDYHVLYAAIIIALAVTQAGDTWGLGRIWARMPFVRRSRWLL